MQIATVGFGERQMTSLGWVQVAIADGALASLIKDALGAAGLRCAEIAERTPSVVVTTQDDVQAPTGVPVLTLLPFEDELRIRALRAHHAAYFVLGRPLAELQRIVAALVGTA